LRRADLLAVLALSGCMKIYPDPELPDAVVEWYPEDCNAGAIVALSLVGIDTPATRMDVDVACETGKHTFVDVARERFRVEGAVLEAGEITSTASYDIDLRDGLDDTAYLYFSLGVFDNYKVAWTFDMGATCESLGAESVMIAFAEPGQQDAFGWTASCDFGMYRGVVGEGTYTVRAIAMDSGTPVAVSPPTPAVTITFMNITDLGTLVMSPCAGECM